MPYDLLIKQARVHDEQPLQDIAIQNGVIVEMAPALSGEAKKIIQANGKVVSPGLIEAHIHLDKALIADRLANQSGTLQEAIQVTAQLKPTFTKDDIYKRAKKTLWMLIQNGVTHIRCQTEFDPAQGFSALEVILHLKKEFANYIDMQIVAFPQEGIFKNPGTEAMMYQAMEMGADVVGGIPYNDLSAEQHIDFCFALAQKYNKPVDFHQDFQDDADKMSIVYLAKKTIATNYENKVSVGHLTALGALTEQELKPIANLLATAKVNVFSLPATDLHLGGRKDDGKVRRALTPVKQLMQAGVNVAIATNNIRNAFTPYGNGDLLITAQLAIAGSHLGGASTLHQMLNMLTYNPAHALNLNNYGLAKGKTADLVVFDSDQVKNVVLDIPTRLYVIKKGQVVVSTNKTTIIHPLV